LNIGQSSLISQGTSDSSVITNNGDNYKVCTLNYDNVHVTFCITQLGIAKLFSCSNVLHTVTYWC